MPFDPVTPVTRTVAGLGRRAGDASNRCCYTPQGDVHGQRDVPDQPVRRGRAWPRVRTPLLQPSDVAQPGTAEFDAVVTDNFARGVTLDDGASTNYLSAANSALTPPFITTDGTFRVGAPADFSTDVIVDYQFGAWRFQPLVPLTDANDQTLRDVHRRAATRAATRWRSATVTSTSPRSTSSTTSRPAASPTRPVIPVSTARRFNDRSGAPITVRACTQGGVERQRAARCMGRGEPRPPAGQDRGRDQRARRRRRRPDGDRELRQPRRTRRRSHGDARGRLERRRRCDRCGPSSRVPPSSPIKHSAT